MRSLWESALAPDGSVGGEFSSSERCVSRAALAAASTVPDLDALRGSSVLIATRAQLPTALALLELDGVARRVVLCTPELTDADLGNVARTAAADALLVSESRSAAAANLPRQIRLLPEPRTTSVQRRASEHTEWVLLTSGTTAEPRLVVHTLASLAGSWPRTGAGRRVWSTFYDIRRYGGLQIYLRALLGGASLVLSDAAEPVAAFLARAAAAGVTHISGTPSHWRRALMSGAAERLHPEYVRLSGEVADQALLDRLGEVYPRATVAHAFASTEAGLAFEVSDGQAGFPAAFIEEAGRAGAGIDLAVIDGTLRIRSAHIALRYLGSEPSTLTDADGFIDTGDLVERVGERYYFRGRRGGVINVGGLKVYPEEVEAVLNAHPRVLSSQVYGRRNSITGALVVADIVLAEHIVGTGDAGEAERVKRELLSVCRASLAPHKVPALLHVVPALQVTAAGKLLRPMGPPMRRPEERSTGRRSGRSTGRPTGRSNA
jgi:acyl-coenzyme A synthetase/AMP-(fatty) acid ligase